MNEFESFVRRFETPPPPRLAEVPQPPNDDRPFIRFYSLLDVLRMLAGGVMKLVAVIYAIVFWLIVLLFVFLLLVS